MRSKKLFVIVSLVGMAGFGIVWFGARSGEQAARQPASAPLVAEREAVPAENAEPVVARILASTPNLEGKPLEESEKQAVDRLATLLASAERMKSSKELARELKRAGLRPVIGRDENPYTGRLDIVRTRDALPGTRYFHAQVFENGTDSEGAFAQHVSFQVRPGKDSMDVALAAIRDTHRDLGNPEINRPDYVLWRTKEGRVVSAKRMTSEDLQGNLFNAQDPVGDVGTIWVVSEDDPEDEAESDHGHT